MDYHLTWYKCYPHWDNVQWPWPRSIPQSQGHTRYLTVRVHMLVSAL